MKRKFMSAILTFATVCAFVPCAVSAETSGTCGEGLTWILDDNGTLTISGTGDMDDYAYVDDYVDAPWYDSADSIVNVVIEDGVTSVGDCAFSKCGSLMSVTIPEGVTSIGDYAFAYSGLISADIPDSVADIGDDAFTSCTSLTDITIPEGVTIIRKHLLSSCPCLTSINIPSGVTVIDYYAFDMCDSLTDVYYDGTKDEWNAIAKADDNSDELINAVIHCSDGDLKMTVLLNGTELSFDQPPVSIRGSMMVPVRAIFEALGYTVDWDGETQTAEAVNGADSITVRIGDNIINYTIGGQSGTYTCDTVPRISSGRTIVPVRAVAESAGCTVDWNSDAKTVTITK